MDLSSEELDISPPCFLVENSQVEESEQLCQYDSNHHVTILKRLPIFSPSATRADRSSFLTNESVVSVPRHPVAVGYPTGSGERGQQGDPRGEQRDGGQRQERGGGDGHGGGGDGAGDGGDDGGGDDDNDDENDEESTPSEEPSLSTSSDAMPELVRPEAVVSSDQWKGRRFSASEMLLQQAAERRAHSESSSSSGVVAEPGSGGSVHDSSGDHYSQASTGIVGADDDVAADMPSVVGSASLSEESTAPVVSPVETEKKSTSSSSIGLKSEQSSAASSSSYHGDLSSLSSGGSHSLSPEVRKHLPLHSMLRTQSTSDTSSSSAGSKEDKIHGKVVGYKVMSLREDNEACSSQEDMFAPREVEKEQGHVHSDLSSDGSHILPPQHHSTPTEGQGSKGFSDHAQEKSLYQQVLTTKQRTSTPVEGGGFFRTPPSQGTPTDSVSRFQSLQFSGEPSARETSSSSSDKVSPSPDEPSSLPVLIPSPTTAGEDDSAEEISNRKEKSTEGEHSMEKERHIDNQGQSELERAAAAVVESFDSSEGEYPEQPTSPKHRATLGEDEVMIPRWQQLQEIPKQDTASSERKTTSNPSSSEKASSDDAVEGDSLVLPQMQEWQSVTSALGSTSSTSQGVKVGTAGQVLGTSSKDQPVHGIQLVDTSFLESSEPVPVISKEQYLKKVPQGDHSLSPSSLAFNPFPAEESSSRGTDEGPVVVPGPTQPEMSEDMFRPTITQGSAQPQDIAAGKPADKSMEDDHVAEDSQEIVFSLHLTQSQADMESQVSVEASVPMEEIPEEGTVTEYHRDAHEDKPADTPQREEVDSLTKQDSGSQSILAPLVQTAGLQPLHVHVPSVIESRTAKPQDRNQELPVTRAQQDGSSDVVRVRDAPQLSTENATVVSPPEQPVLAEDSGEVPSQVKDDASEDLARRLSTPEKGLPPRKPIKPRLPATIFSETSSESGLSGEFHFSLPKEPLRPILSTTPPPIRPVRHDTPDSQERGNRRTIIPEVILPVVSETPGMSSQAPSSSLDQLRPQSLTVSMPRQGSPLSENSEPPFRFSTTLPSVSVRPGSSAANQPNAPEQQRSIFSRIRENIAKNKKKQLVVDSEHDPFAFTAEDDNPEPLSKRPRREPRKASTAIAEEGPSEGQGLFTTSSSLCEKITAKRGRSDEIDDAAGSEEAEERGSKRTRKEEDEPMPAEESGRASSEVVHYRQITHTRTVTTVTTQVQRVVTVSIVDKESGEVVEELTYEEDGQPNIESEEKEKEEVHEFVESACLDGSRVTLTSKSPKRRELQQRSRSSPRIKNGRTMGASKVVSKQAPRASGKTQADGATPGKGSSGRDPAEAVDGSAFQSRQESLAEVPVITRQATEPVVEEDLPLQRTSSSDSSLTPGTRVLAKWLDSYFYPGVITTKQYKNGRYLVTFDDGDKRRIPRENLIIKDLLPAGQSVMAQGDGEDDFYEQGVIVGHYRDGCERGYEIQTQSGAISRFPRSRVILSERQATAILSGESSFNVTSGSSASIGAHSLRLRKEGGSGSRSDNSHNITKSGSTGAKDTSRDTSRKDTSSSSSDEKTRGKKAARPSPRFSPKASKAKTSAATDETPKSTHKSTHKAKAQARRTGHRIGESESSSDERHGARPGRKGQVRRGLSASYGARSPDRTASGGPSEPLTRRSPGKQTSEKEVSTGEDTATGTMPVNRNMFAGLAFLVTGVERDRDDTDDSDSESERIEFNRDNIKGQIEAGGGVVLASFPQSQISGAECFLVSNRHQRTQKYFQSLASGIPCVSHMWINDSCAGDKLLNYKRYLLPAGESLEAEGEIVECRPRRNILGDMRVYLHGSQKFKDTWTSVLLAAGCKMVTKIPNRLDYQCDVVICEDQKLPASVRHAANTLGIPIVSLEWLLQSLINGRKVPFDGHPKYDYRYKGS